MGAWFSKLDAVVKIANCYNRTGETNDDCMITRSHSHLWPQALSSDQSNEITNEPTWASFAGWLVESVRSSVIPKELGVELLLLRFESSQLRWSGLVLVRMPPESLPGAVFWASPKGRRPRGTPRTQWRDYIPQLACANASINALTVIYLLITNNGTSTVNGFDCPEEMYATYRPEPERKTKVM